VLVLARIRQRGPKDETVVQVNRSNRRKVAGRKWHRNKPAAVADRSMDRAMTVLSLRLAGWAACLPVARTPK
jgi:hypothetical protein